MYLEVAIGWRFGFGSDQFDSVRLSGHGSGIESFSVGSFQISGRIRSDRVGYRVI
jgi:hypothetical protein